MYTNLPNHYNSKCQSVILGALNVTISECTLCTNFFQSCNDCSQDLLPI